MGINFAYPGAVRAAFNTSSDRVHQVAVAGTALLLSATSVLLAQQDPATASAPFPVTASTPITVEVVAKRFTFEPSRIEVAEGDHVRLVVTSADGVHGIGIKKFKVERTIPRDGEPVTIDFVASAAGTFPILCSEYCGKGHEQMKGTLVVAVAGHDGPGGSAPPTETTEPGPSSDAPAQEADDPDLDVNLAQPDFKLATLATTLRLPRHKMAFDLTHRFGRPLGAGSFGSLVGDLFGFDSGAVVGIDLRYGLARGAQVGVYRTSDRTIQLSTQYEIRSQKTFPLGVAAVASLDGTNNFRDEYSPSLEAVFSREVGDRAAVYAEPAWVHHSNIQPSGLTADDDTVLVGVGARVRVLKATYLMVEASPRVSGYAPGVTHISYGVEGRAGGHLFQLNFSNGYGTTLAQVARGGTSYSDWYIGFNLSRKFY